MILIFLKNLQNQKNQSKKKKKSRTLKNAIILLNGKQKVLNEYPNSKQGKRLTSILDNQLKILTPKEMLQRLSLARSQVKASNISDNLLNESYEAEWILYL